MENSKVKRIKIYSDRKYLPEGIRHVVILYPFWGKNPEDPKKPESGQFDNYEKLGHLFFEMTPLSEADFAVLPTIWEAVMENYAAKELATQFINLATEAGKPVLLFLWADSDDPILVKNTVIFRTALTGAKRSANEFAMPAWSEDFIVRYCRSTLNLRQKQKKPVVGFCGYAAADESAEKTPPGGRVKDTLRWGIRLAGIRKPKVSPSRPGVGPHGWRLRAKALRILSASSLVETNFVVRDHCYFADTLDSIRQGRKEYVGNMLSSDYIVCGRGGGNFSYRLYETLCCGRIPVFINTDCILPYEAYIDWKKYCVWVDESDISKLPQAVAEFHKKLSPEDFIVLQKECREIWEQWLSPEGFFGNLHHHLVT
jgi:Exostosin family